MNRKQQIERDRAQYVQFLIKEGIENLVRAEDLKVDNVIVDYYNGIQYWEVFRKINEWDRTQLILDPAVDISGSFQHRRATVVHQGALVRVLSAIPIAVEHDRHV